MSGGLVFPVPQPAQWNLRHQNFITLNPSFEQLNYLYIDIKLWITGHVDDKTRQPPVSRYQANSSDKNLFTAFSITQQINSDE